MVIKTTTPNTRALNNCLPQIDYADTFAITNHKDSLAVICQKALGTAPGWVVALMKLRNTIVKVFGLKTDIPDTEIQKFEEGSKVAFFHIYQILENEVILGENDRHLNFRVSVYNSKEREHNIKMTTLVQYHNAFGRIYFAIVKPFHLLIVKSMLKKAIA